MTRPIPRILAVAPGGLIDPGIVVAGSRAGALGVLDAGFRFEAGALLEGAGRVSRYLGEKAFGLRVAGEATRGPADWLERLPAALGVIVVEGIAAGREAETLDVIRRSGRLALAEVTTRGGALSAS